ncbi:MAG: hypothetical protein KZQ66_14875 [Candidatus Thiodiazotropha sp. (ex Lucinoma aequizonata)]|nr:hypothetical protein [Candidatus Thiodiazotropha sp. (ex Lucinoma aequizonata)]MCU7888914.1 hypothetical protein [Candidatus Thiodiazotropha sp. (ex Lucinoma aequizonata)]MCU7897128.1 hypothetical protein [Candidatus Thiodiazotropha sp. (ex Lucinoma aequizonata)]MCU7897315.1 hypothetical protein [Candidatus Thiodiazotropha sp. (ex Lucinoma aequizonata)]MCU7903119.1 hypothetical protein [Candidatus Thiodiazotropha sp. (ex Lucinoma aequizonata)]
MIRVHSLTAMESGAKAVSPHVRRTVGTSQSTKIGSIFDSLLCPDRPAYVTIPYCTSTASCSCTTPS